MTQTARPALIAVVVCGAVSACGTGEPSTAPPTSTTVLYTRVDLANPCDSVPAELFAQQHLSPRSSIWYPDNDPTIPDSSSNGCDVQVLNSKSHFTLTVTNRDFDKVREGYSGLVKTDRSVQGKPLDGRRADVYQVFDTQCMVLVDLPGGTLKMDGSFTDDPAVDACKRAVELARAFVPYISITQR